MTNYEEAIVLDYPENGTAALIEHVFNDINSLQS